MPCEWSHVLVTESERMKKEVSFLQLLTFPHTLKPVEGLECAPLAPMCCTFKAIKTHIYWHDVQINKQKLVAARVINVKLPANKRIKTFWK